MQISKNNKPHQLSVWLLQIDRVKLIGRNLDELNECCSWVEVENKKNNDSLSRPSYPMNLQCLQRKIPIKKEKKRKERKKNTDRKQTKLNVPHVIYNVKIPTQ